MAQCKEKEEKAEDKTRWKGIVVKSSVVAQKPGKVMG